MLIDDLDEDEARGKLAALYEELAQHDLRYFRDDAPIISDEGYDNLRRLVESIRAKFPNLINFENGSERVGAPPSNGFREVVHSLPMLSLENAFQFSDVTDFLNRVRRILGLKDDENIVVVGEPKIDGLSAALRYENGIFVRGATRGDGISGEDITTNLQTIPDIPQKLSGSTPRIIEVRGEVFMSRYSFRELNAQQKELGRPLYANSRNAASGSLRQLDHKITASRKLEFRAYAWGEASELPTGTHWEMLRFLNGWGFKIQDGSRVCSIPEHIFAYYKEIEALRGKMSFDIDGVVYKINRLDWQERLGVRSKSPRWAIAHKFVSEKAETLVRSIDIQVGRSGKLTPVARLEPVLLGGVTISNATLHNEDYITQKDVRAGDTVLIQRAGDVIPQILHVVKAKRPENVCRFEFPSACPECGSPATREPGESDTRCTGGLICKAQALERLQHFVGRNGLDIEGLGGKQIDAFFIAGLVTRPDDIFTLRRRNNVATKQLHEWEGWGETSVTNLLNAIDRRRMVSLDRFIFSLGIRHIGRASARLLAREFQSFESFYAGLVGLDNSDSIINSDFLNIDGIGQSLVDSLYQFMAVPQNQEIIQELLKEITVTDFENPIGSNSPLAGKTIVFTGTLQSTTRLEAKVRAEQLGAKVGTTVSRKTDLVISGLGSGSKLKKAEELGINVMNEDEWSLLSKR